MPDSDQRERRQARKLGVGVGVGIGIGIGSGPHYTSVGPTRARVSDSSQARSELAVVVSVAHRRGAGVATRVAEDRGQRAKGSVVLLRWHRRSIVLVSS